MPNDRVDILRVIVILIVAVAIVGSLIGLPSDIINQIIEWLVSIFISATFAILAASLVEAVSGDLLKKYVLLNIKITENLSMSISLFTVATIIVKYLLFGDLQ